jgi:hypothetical protein
MRDTSARRNPFDKRPAGTTIRGRTPGRLQQHRTGGLERSVMIIDCHGHYTTEPQKLHDFR